jgi:phosphatidylserine decarboxylase
MVIDAAGWPFVGGAFVTAGLLGWWGGWWAAAPDIALGFAFLFFFRDPDRDTSTDPNAVVSPADGRVMIAGPPVGGAVPPGQWQQISIFLSPLNVHINRIPVGGRVTCVKYHPGRFLPAYRSEAGDLNEFTEVWVDHAGEPIVFRQIVGVLARRVVCRAKEGDTVTAGQRFGVMKFGSRMDVFVPVTAQLAVRPNDRVVGGVTTIAALAPRGDVHDSSAHETVLASSSAVEREPSRLH